MTKNSRIPLIQAKFSEASRKAGAKLLMNRTGVEVAPVHVRDIEHSHRTGVEGDNNEKREE